MPVGIFLKFKDKLDAIYAVNDYSCALGICRVGYSITDETGKVVAEDAKDINIKRIRSQSFGSLMERFTAAVFIMLPCGLSRTENFWHRMDITMYLYAAAHARPSDLYEP